MPSLPVGRAVVCPLPPQVLTIWDSGVGWTNEWGAVCCGGALAGTTSESLLHQGLPGGPFRSGHQL